MALTILQKSSCRRHLQYPVIGLLRVSPGGGTLASAAAGYRYNEAYGFLEYKMNNMNPDEEARLTGLAVGAVALVGPQPNPGDTMTVVFSGGPLVSPVTVTVVAPTNPDPTQDMRITMANAIAGAVSTNATLQAKGFIAGAPYGTGPFAQNAVAIAECAFTNPESFSISCSGTGQLAPQVTAPGLQVPPSTSLDGVTTIYGYLPILDGLENAYGTASQNLDTLVADVWRGRSNEAGARFSLYAMWVDRLQDFLGIPLNPMRKARPSQRGALRYA